MLNYDAADTKITVCCASQLLCFILSFFPSIYMTNQGRLHEELTRISLIARRLFPPCTGRRFQLTMTEVSINVNQNVRCSLQQILIVLFSF